MLRAKCAGRNDHLMSVVCCVLLWSMHWRTLCVFQCVLLNSLTLPACWERTEVQSPTDLGGSGWTAHSNLAERRSSLWGREAERELRWVHTWTKKIYLQLFSLRLNKQHYLQFICVVQKVTMNLSRNYLVTCTERKKALECNLYSMQ